MTGSRINPPQEELLKYSRKRWDISGVASLALLSKSNLEFYHLDWLGMRWSKIKRRPKKEIEPSRIQQTWSMTLCHNHRNLNKNRGVCFYPIMHSETCRNQGTSLQMWIISALFLPSHLPDPPHSYPSCQECVKYALTGRKEVPQKDKLEVGGPSTKPLLSCGHLFLISVQAKWPPAWECVWKLHPLMPVSVLLNLTLFWNSKHPRKVYLYNSWKVKSLVYLCVFPGVQSPCFQQECEQSPATPNGLRKLTEVFICFFF